MAAKHHRHIALTELLDRFVEQQVAAGFYASASDVVSAGLLLVIAQQHAGDSLADEKVDERG